MGTKTKLLIAATLGLVIAGSGAILWQKQNTKEANRQTTITPTPIPEVNTQSFSYQGENGKDALTLLRSKTDVEQDNSGLVVSIDRKKADSSRREYWAFYINGELSSVGPKDYITKNDDLIEWKVENY